MTPNVKFSKVCLDAFASAAAAIAAAPNFGTITLRLVRMYMGGGRAVRSGIMLFVNRSSTIFVFAVVNRARGDTNIIRSMMYNIAEC